MKIDDIFKDAVLLSVKRSLKDLPVGVDIPRLANRVKVVRIVDNDSINKPLVSVSTSQNTTYNDHHELDMSELPDEADEEQKQHNNVYRLLNDLALRFQPEVLEHLTINDFQEKVDFDIHDSLIQYLMQFDEDKPLVRILKSIHQSIVGTVLTKLRIALGGTEMRLKDIRYIY
jgi:hypothetical protein